MISFKVTTLLPPLPLSLIRPRFQSPGWGHGIGTSRSRSGSRACLPLPGPQCGSVAVSDGPRVAGVGGWQQPVSGPSSARCPWHSSSRSLSIVPKDRMEYNWLGSTGLMVPSICLGTMTFGEHQQGRPGCTEKEAHAIIDRYVALGGNFIDTADMYQNGLSESIIGNWLEKHKEDRHKLIIATKCGKNKEDGNPNSLGASRSNILSCVDKALERLKTAYIDIFYIHVWDDGTPVEESLGTLNDLVRNGKVRYVAMSNAKGWQLQKMVETCRYRGWAPLICLQQQYSLLCRSIEWEVADVCKNEGLGLLPWSPLKGGWLSGKMHRGASGAPEGSRIAWASGRAHHSHPDWEWYASNEQAWNILDKLEEIAKARGKTVAQVSLRWLLQKPYVPSVVIGIRTMEQLEDNMGAVGWQLSEEEMSVLDQVSSIPSPYPYDYLIKDNLTRQRP